MGDQLNGITTVSKTVVGSPILPPPAKYIFLPGRIGQIVGLTSPAGLVDNLVPRKIQSDETGFFEGLDFWEKSKNRSATARGGLSRIFQQKNICEILPPPPQKTKNTVLVFFVLFFSFFESNSLAKFFTVLFKFYLAINFFLIFSSPVYFPC